MKKTLFLLLALSVLFSILPAPVRALEDPVIDHAKSAYLYNFENDVVLFKMNEHETVFPAASVKMMTGIVAYELLSSRFDETVSVTASMLNEVKGNNISLDIGETVLIRDMMYALLTNCANDAAYVLAYTACGSAESFVLKMNQKAAELGAFDTHYTNPTGMHDDKMVTTAYDTAIIAKALHENEVLSEMVSVKNHVMDATNMREYRNLYNKNALIYTQPGSEKSYRYATAVGMNAGYTTQGGYCVTALAEDDGLSYLCIVMGADEIDGEIYSYKNAEILLDWAFASYKYVAVLSKGVAFTEIPVKLSSAVDHVTLIPVEDVYVYLPADTDLAADISTPVNTFDDYLNAPVKAGQECGYVTVMYKDDIIASVKLVTNTDIARSDFLYYMNRIKEFSHSTFFIATVITAVVLTVLYIFIKATRSETKRRKRAVKGFLPRRR